VQNDKMTRTIGIFAHNEAGRITACLESVRNAIKLGDECVVLNNGSTDNTSSLVEEFSEANSFCRVVNIPIGDKASAWNIFVHEMGLKADLFVFLDGDCEIAPNSIDALEKCMMSNPGANAAAAIPSERSSRKNREIMLKEGGLSGNLYALPNQFVERLRNTHTRLPFGLIGDDSLVGALACWNLNPKGEWDDRKIIICRYADFSYVPLSPFSLSDIRLYYRRKIRYSLRYFQILLMKAPLEEHGLAAITDDIADLYRSHFTEMKVKWRGIDTFFDYLALKQIKKRMDELA